MELQAWREISRRLFSQPRNLLHAITFYFSEILLADSRLLELINPAYIRVADTFRWAIIPDTV
jgi:hypothetical protein